MLKKHRITALIMAVITLALLPAGPALAGGTRTVESKSRPAIRDAVTIARWQQTSAGARAYNAQGKVIKNGFGFDGTYYYSLDADGAVRKGWYLESVLRDGSSAFDPGDEKFFRGVACILPTENVAEQHVCYFDEVTGAMAVGWLSRADDWLYFDFEGRMQRYGWLQTGGKWYYFGGMSFWGTMQTGWVSDGFGWYYMKSNGEMATGWVKSGQKWYHLKPSGRMEANAWVKSGSKWYYMNAGGDMAAGQWVKSKGSWYYMDTDGAMATSRWVKTNDNSGAAWYYVKADGTMMHSGTFNIGGDAYTFAANGKWDGK